VEILSIGITAPTASLRQRLARGLRSFLEKGIAVEINEVDGKPFNIVTLSLTAPNCSAFTQPDLSEIGRQFAAPVLADYLIEEWSLVLLKRLIEKDFRYFSPDEQGKIMSLAYSLLNCENMLQLSRQSTLRERLTEFMADNRHINPEGFLRFRLPDYSSVLRDALAQAVEEYLTEKEYQEFVRLLRYFVEIQEPKLPLVHVVIDTEGFCQIYDRNYCPLYHEYLGGFDEGEDREASYEDLVISALITLAPHKVILHRDGRNRADMYSTIRQIFESRVADCLSCDFCHRTTVLPGGYFK